MYILQIEFGTPAFDEAVQLRYEVLRRPLGLEYTPEQLAAEYDQIHLAAYSDSGILLGYLNLSPVDAQIVKMRQVAVGADWQKKGVGKAMVAASEALALHLGFAHMVLHARETAVPFYKTLEYNMVGDRFEEVGIPHYRMEKAL
jgi:GNAT superfamily N-acetyltransferase